MRIIPFYIVASMFGCASFLISGCDRKLATPAAGSQEPIVRLSAPAESSKETDPKRKTVVAKVGNAEITVGDVMDELQGQNPYIRMSYNSPERKKELVTNLTRVEVLAQEALKQGLQQDPEVIRRVKRTIADLLMQKLQRDLVKMENIGDEQLRAYYDKNKHLYQQSAKVRVSQIVVATKAEAEKVLALLKQKPNDTNYFAELVRQYSTDAPSKAQQGDLGFFAQDAEQVPAEIRQAAFAISRTGEVSSPIKVKEGFAVVMRTGERAAISRTFDEEKEQIRDRLFKETRWKAIDDYVKTLEQKAQVTINDAAVNEIRISTSDLPDHLQGRLKMIGYGKGTKEGPSEKGEPMPPGKGMPMLKGSPMPMPPGGPAPAPEGEPSLPHPAHPHPH